MIAPASLTAGLPAADLVRRFRSHRLRLALLLFVGYVGYYFCRVTLPVALPVFGESLRFSNTQTGLILSSFYLVYAFAKLVNGLLTDRLGGKVILLVGIAGTVACNVLFGLGTSLSFFVVVWGANAFFQSMGWLALVSIMAQWYHSSESGRVMGVMSLTYQAGDFAARASAALLIGVIGWIGLFWAHAALLGLVGIALLFLVQPSPQLVGLPDLDAYRRYSGMPDLAPTAEAPADQSRRWLRTMLAHKGFWLVCAVYLFLSVIRYIFWGWSVQYILSHGARIGTAVITSAIFPLLGSLGTISAGWVSDRMQGRRGPVLVVMSVALAGAIFLFGRVPADQPALLMIALGLVGFTLYGPYSLMAGAVAMDFGSRYASAAAAGIIDSIGAFGAIATGVGMGYLIDTVGWNSAFGLIGGLAAGSALLSLGLWKLRPLN